MAGLGKYVGAETTHLLAARRRLTVERMAPPDAPPPIDPVVERYVEAVVRELLLPGELDRWELRWQLDARDGWMLLAVVDARGERYIGFITQANAEYPMEDGPDTFTDGFENFISESRFAWGQLRELTDRPWRPQL